MAPKTRLVGMRFHPTDEELVNHYLKRKHLKLGDQHQEDCIIPDIDIYTHDPPKLNKVYDEISDEKSDGNYCYFFCPRDSTKNGYTKRKTIDGFWKETSEKQVVQDEATEEVMWTKRYFVYHHGPQRSSCKTDWVMHEYCLGSRPGDDTSSDKAAFALCHIKRKKKKNKQVKQRRTNTPAKSSGAQQGSSFAQAVADQLLEIPGTEEESMHCLPQTVTDQQLKIPGAKEESMSIQLTIESAEITTDTGPMKQSVNDKLSDEQSENISMANTFDTVYEDYICTADLPNLDQDAFWDELY